MTWLDSHAANGRRIEESIYDDPRLSSSGATTARRGVATPAAGSESTTTALLESTTALTGTVVTTATGAHVAAAASLEARATELVGVLAALFDEDGSSANLVRVGRDSSLEALLGCKLDKRRVLCKTVSIMPIHNGTIAYLGTANVEVGDLVELGQSALQLLGVGALVNILDVGANGGGLSGLVLGTRLALAVVATNGLPSILSAVGRRLGAVLKSVV